MLYCSDSSCGDGRYVPKGWWHTVLNLEFSVALTHNVVTARNLLAVTDFYQDSVACDDGEGCRGNLAINLSGDVPTSVIFPYNDKTSVSRADRPRSCHCLRKRQRLLEELEAGLALAKPGYLSGLRAERQAKKLLAADAQARLNSLFKPQRTTRGAKTGAKDEPTSFSFGFGF
jgi:hypothetical protein